MTRGWARCLSFLIVPLLPSLGCDALTVHPFAGTVAQFTLSGASVTPVGQHIEVWARDQYNDIIRLNPFYDESNLDPAKTTPGLMVRQAVSVDSPCMIDSHGYLLTDPAAYPTTSNLGDVTQTPEEQAAAVVQRIKQLTPAAPGPLLAILPWDATPDPVIPAGTAAEDRKKMCDKWKAMSPNTYVPNPLQITTPLNGTVYGFVSFSTTLPPTNYDGYRLDMPVSLKGVQEIFFTVEGDTVDPNHRGPLFLVSTRTVGGTDVIHFDLTSPAGSMVAIGGTAALYVNLDQPPAANEF